MRRKSLALLLCATMVCATAPVDTMLNSAVSVKNVKAAEITSGDFTYDTNGVDSITITKYTGSASSLAIPEKIDGYTVTKIGESAFDENKNLQSVEIPDSVTEIDKYAFYKCEKLEAVKLPANLNTLGYRAFMNCSALSSVAIPKTLEEASTPFKGCGKLYTATIESGAKKVCATLFEESGVENVTIPDTVEKIEGEAFDDCDNMKSIEIPDSVTEIERYAFYSCEKLETVKLPTKLYTLGYRAFMNCSALSSVAIPKTLEEASTPFKGCGNLYTVTIESGAKKVCATLFEESGVENVTIPDTVEKIEHGAFDDCINIKSIEIPDSVTEIERNAFYGCKNLEKIEFPANLKTMGYAAFSNCSKLKNIYFHGSAPETESSIFSNVTATVYIPEGDTTWTDDKKKKYDGTLTWKTFASTKQPTVTKEPVVTQEPAVTDEPEITQKPQVTKTPVVTEEPEETQAPVITPVPIVTQTPAPTASEEPEITLEEKVGKAAIKSAKAAGKKKIKVSWKKASCVEIETIKTSTFTHKFSNQANVSGYKIQYTTNKKFSSAKSKNVSAKKTSIILSSLKKGKTYYVRVCAYKKVEGTTIYGAWSSVKKCKVK